MNQLVSYLNGRNVEVTVDELSKALELPTTSNSMQIPTMAFGGAGVPTPVHSVAVPRRTTRGSGVTCKFILTRGDNEGKLCGKTATVGSEFCSNHNKNTTAKGKPRDKSAYTPGLAPAPKLAPATKENSGLDVNPLPGNPGYFITNKYNFVIALDENEQATVIGKLVRGSDGDSNVKLTRTDVELACTLGLTSFHPEACEPESPKKPLMPLASLPGLSNPGLGSSMVPGLSNPLGLTQLPKVAASLTTLDSVTPIPMIPVMSNTN